MNTIPRRRFPAHALRSRAFTLVELLLVLVILATLAAVVVPKFSGRSEQARVTAARTEISGLELALDAFEVDNGFYPKGDDGLSALFENTDDLENWQGYLKKRVEADPWNNPYVYECPGRYNQNGYDLMSMGPDGQVGGEDDITNWQQGSE